MGHPLGTLLFAAARGSFPAPDGSVDVVGSPPGRADAVVAFSAHSVVAADVDPDDVRAHLDPGDFGATMDARFLTWLGHRLGAAPGMVDVVMAADRAPATIELVRRDDLVGHPRAARAVRYRDDVTVHSDQEGRGLVTVGRGLAGRLEVSVEVDPEHRGRGLGRALFAAARALAPHGGSLFAQVSPGNVSSVRALLAAGYRPICSEVLFLRG